MPRRKKNYSTDLDFVFCECTCGRVRYDFADLAVIIEEDGKCFTGKGKARKSPKSMVVCLRPGCKGKKKSAKLFVDKLPRIMNFQYLQIKKQQEIYIQIQKEEEESAEHNQLVRSSQPARAEVPSADDEEKQAQLDFGQEV